MNLDRLSHMQLNDVVDTAPCKETMQRDGKNLNHASPKDVGLRF